VISVLSLVLGFVFRAWAMRDAERPPERTEGLSGYFTVSYPSDIESRESTHTPPERGPAIRLRMNNPVFHYRPELIAKIDAAGMPRAFHSRDSIDLSSSHFWTFENLNQEAMVCLYWMRFKWPLKRFLARMGWASK
jgi:hypothetical protein